MQEPVAAATCMLHAVSHGKELECTGIFGVNLKANTSFSLPPPACEPLLQRSAKAWSGGKLLDLCLGCR
jgi:hypothetical protein